MTTALIVLLLWAVEPSLVRILKCLLLFERHEVALLLLLLESFDELKQDWERIVILARDPRKSNFLILIKITRRESDIFRLAHVIEYPIHPR